MAPPGQRRDADPALPTCRGSKPANRPAPRRGPGAPGRPRRHDRRGRQGAAVRRAGRAAARRRGVPRTRRCVAASRVAQATGAKLLGETFPARLERGAGRPPVERLGYFAEFAMAQLDGVRHLVLVDTPAPVSFFAYPGQAELPRARRTARCTCSRRRRRRRERARAPRRRARCRRRPTSRCKPAGRPDAPDRRAHRGAVAHALGATAARGRDRRPTRRRPAACSRPGATAGAPPPRLADAHRRRDRLGHARRDRRRGRVPRPHGVVPRRPTAARCTRCRRCGRRRARASTSRRSSSTTGRTRSSTSSSAASAPARPGPSAQSLLDLTEPDARLRRARRGHGRRRDATGRPPRSSPPRSSARSPSPGPHLDRRRAARAA